MLVLGSAKWVPRETSGSQLHFSAQPVHLALFQAPSAAPCPRMSAPDGEQCNPAHVLFDTFLRANECEEVLGSFRALCGHLGLEHTGQLCFYHKLKACLNYWSAKALWSKLDKKAGHKDYDQGRACANTKVGWPRLAGGAGARAGPFRERGKGPRRPMVVVYDCSCDNNPLLHHSKWSCSSASAVLAPAGASA